MYIGRVIILIRCIIIYTEHCSVWSYQFYWYYYYRHYGEDEDFYGEDEDFYGGRTGPLEKFYLFIYFLLI